MARECTHDDVVRSVEEHAERSLGVTVLRTFTARDEVWMYVDADIGIHWVVRRSDGTFERIDVGARRMAGERTERFMSTDGRAYALVIGVDSGAGWLLTSVSKTGEAHYRYSTEGINLYSGEAFSWRVPDIGERYDTSLVGASVL